MTLERECLCERCGKPDIGASIYFLNFTVADSDNCEGKFGYEDAEDVKYGY